MKQRELRPPPAAIIVGTKWLANQSYFEPQCQSILDKLHRAEVWHQLGKRRPTVPRARLIEELSKWSRGQVPDSVIEEVAKSFLVIVPDEVSDKDIALLTVFVASFTLAALDVRRAYTRADLAEFEDLWREEASSLREEAAVLKKHGHEAQAEELELQASEFEGDAEASEFEPEFNPIFEELDDRLLIERHQAPPHVPAYCVLLAKAMRAVYGRDLRGTVAAIATTALDRQVSPHDVRYWCANKRA